MKRGVVWRSYEELHGWSGADDKAFSEPAEHQCRLCAGEQRQDSAVEVGGLAVHLVQGAVGTAEMVLVGAAPCDGLFPVDGRVVGGRWRDWRRGRRRLRFVGGLRVDAVDCELAIYLAGSLHAKWHGLRT